MKTLNEHIQKALGHAIDLHKEQKRKGTEKPYSLHPVSLAMMLTEMAVRPAIIAAALLHDVVEDTPWTFDDLERNYTSEIAELVCACTEEHRNEKWEIRKTSTLERFNEQPDDAKWVIISDKLHNLYSMNSLYEEIGEALWENFSRGYEKQKWYYSNFKTLFTEEPLLKDTKLYESYVYYYGKLFEV